MNNRKKSYTDKINQKINNIQKEILIKDIRCLVNLDRILNDNVNRDQVKGFYAEIDLNHFQTFVPAGERFLDRKQRHYNKDKDGQFNLPLLTLKEWREKWKEGHPKDDLPSLLINANWFNVWKSGIPDHGDKINPRKQRRTFLAGLSLSKGEVVSSHLALDQKDVGLDTIIFDIKKQMAKLISHADIDMELKNDPNFYQHKNAVSGFIILNNQILQKTPNLNNNHDNRLPRTGVGYKENGKKLVILVIHHTEREYGVTANEFAHLFLELGCTDAINLDNSGSVELYYQGYSHFGKKNVTICTQTCDKGALTERPKPNCLGFGAKLQFFSYDDMDLPGKAKVNEIDSNIKNDDAMTYSYYLKNS